MKNKKESGEVVVEASIVVTLVMIIITIMMYVGMILYQQTLVSVMANQTASAIAQVYSNNLKDPFSGYVDPDLVYQTVTYTNMKNDAYMAVVEQKANAFGRYRLKSSQILANGNTSIEVDVVRKPNELLKSQVVVTIHDRYDVPLVGLFGTSGLVEFSASGRADCVDILEYIHGVEAVGDPESPSPAFLTDNCTVTFIPDKDQPSSFHVTTVLKGYSVLSSNKYTQSRMPTEPQKGNVEFDGWYDESGARFTASTTVETDMVIYGQWLCEVKMNANGGKIGTGTEMTFKTTYGSRVRLDVPERAGYKFLGWFDSSGAQYISNDTPIVEHVTLTAKWERIIHTVTFDANGGKLPTGVSDKVTVIHESTVSMPNAQLDEYEFKGWYDSSGKKYSSSTKITSSVTLYAKWSECAHVFGDCGECHDITIRKLDFHNKSNYAGTYQAYCIVCIKCGFKDGFWCYRHKLNGGGNSCCDGYRKNHSAGVYPIHSYPSYP